MKTLIKIMILSMLSFSAFASGSIGESMAVNAEDCTVISQSPRVEQAVGNYDVEAAGSSDSSGVITRE
jgi:hypothetical protein